MKNYISIHDVNDPVSLAETALDLKKDPVKFSETGKNKTLGLIFFNPSLRTRLSTQKAAKNLGLQTMVMNFTQEAWQIETEDGVIMDGEKAEHIKEAAAVIGKYCDILGVRSFARLSDREADYSEVVMNKFMEHCNIPLISLESATLHPLQSLADYITINEYGKEKPKVVLTWAPHPKALPQSVANSFAQWMSETGADFTITHPRGYALDGKYTHGAKIEADQRKAFSGADFIYAKNWSSYEEYGQILTRDPSWMVTKEKMNFTNNAKFMHCLPVRRNVVVEDAVLDSENSIVLRQAENRIYAAQAVLLKILEKNR